MEESSSPVDCYRDIAIRIVKVLSDNHSNSFITKDLGFEVLKPLLEKNISNALRIIYKIPDKWFT